MSIDKKTYEKPKLIRRGDVQSVTQAFGDLGSGDLFNTHFKLGGKGCHEELTWLCTGS
jgi:hypothetical protein